MLILKPCFAGKKVEPSPLLQSQIDEYVNFIKEFIEKNAIMEKTFLVVVPFYPCRAAPSRGPQKRRRAFFPLFSERKKAVPAQSCGARKPTRMRSALLRKISEQLTQRTGQVIAGITGIGLDAKRP